MTDSIHERLQDRMPDVAAGRLAWTAPESAHLSECAECRSTWELVQGTARIGRQVEREFDVAAATAGMTARLRAGTGSPRLLRRVALGVTAVAAAVALAVLLPRSGPAPAPAGTAELPAGVRFLPELDSLSTEELNTVAAELDQPSTALDSTDGQNFFELDSTQLERVLRSLEG